MAKGKKQIKKGKKGFTIIEVVLVLAIAGLIFLMVFIALPALQRAQRNTQREDDMSRFLTAVTDFQSNNSGRTPFGDRATNVQPPTLDGNFVTRYIDRACAQAGMGVDGTCDAALGSGDQFTDPDGTVYSFRPGVINVANDPITVTFPNNDLDHMVYVVVGYVCGANEGTVRQGSGTRQISLHMVLEGGAITCNDNQ
ncbi:type II secretion system GspH family protein [Candidatus Saccharibacteria bacterium]|nr:type II secretion system GspH family protein [Candidatus Saccharibacteria bacterium]